MCLDISETMYGLLRVFTTVGVENVCLSQQWVYDILLDDEDGSH